MATRTAALTVFSNGTKFRKCRRTSVVFDKSRDQFSDWIRHFHKIFVPFHLSDRCVSATISHMATTAGEHQPSRARRVVSNCQLMEKRSYNYKTKHNEPLGRCFFHIRDIPACLPRGHQ